MADVLRVHIDAVRESARALASLREALASARTQLCDVHGPIGDEHLSSRLEDLLDGWRIHREQLCGDLDTFSKWTMNAADTYVATDDVLAKSLGGGA